MTAFTLPDVDPAATEQQPGLTLRQVERARAAHGPNELPHVPSASLLGRVVGQLRDPMILLLIGACVVTVWLGDTIDTSVILAVIVLNSAIGVVQEGRAERSLAALESLSAPTARVLREGTMTTVPARDLVPDDVVWLSGGDIVPADLQLTQAHDLQLDESTMTGESMPVPRAVGEEAFSGTVVTRGRATGVVTRTGPDSSLGRIAALVAANPRQPTPLQRRLGALSRVLVIAAGGVSCLVFGIGLGQGREAGEMLVVAVSLAVAAVPESLPAVVSVALALGAYRMSRRSAIVRRLPAVETLGSVTVIATDKTGTLTENRMTAQAGWVADGFFVTDATSNNDGQGPTLAVDDCRIRPLLEALALCNDAHPTRTATGVESLSGDPLDAAVFDLALRGGIDVTRLRSRQPVRVRPCRGA